MILKCSASEADMGRRKTTGEMDHAGKAEQYSLRVRKTDVTGRVAMATTEIGNGLEAVGGACHGVSGEGSLR